MNSRFLLEILRVVALVTLSTLPLFAVGKSLGDEFAPEPATGFSKHEVVRTQKRMVVTANPHASNAGDAILNAGGNAIDAMVAIQLVLGLVEPQSSGLGGGAFLTYFNNQTGRLTTFDGRETAPAGSTPDMFLDDTGEPLGYFDAVVGGLSVGTPATVKLLYDVHQKHGKFPWNCLFSTAITLAEQGFEVSTRLHTLITLAAASFIDPETREYFLTKDGLPLPVGTLLKNPKYATTLKTIRDGGAQAFYTGELAARLVATVKNAPRRPGTLSLEDMASYEIKEREPVCYRYRGFDVCGMGPPSSGALTVGQILGLVEYFQLNRYGPYNPESWRIIGDATRLAFADRELYMADSDFVRLPTGLLNRVYLRLRSFLLCNNVALPPDTVKAGKPPNRGGKLFGPDQSLELPSTSHFSIADEDGNVVSMTTTIENGFGSLLMVDGFLLNNELTDFSFVPNLDGRPVANSVQPGKRPRSAMSPTIILKNGKPVLAIGSPGGSRIIPYVATTIIAWIDWNMNIQEAISLPHFVNRFGIYDVERNTSAECLVSALEAIGYQVSVRDLNSGLHGIEITSRGLEGGADPRREGLAVGE